MHAHDNETDTMDHSLLSRPKVGSKTCNTLVSPFDTALAATEHLLRLLVKNVAQSRTGKRDSIGLIVYGDNLKNHSNTTPTQNFQNHEQLDEDQSSSSDSISSNSTDGPHINTVSNTKVIIPLSPPGVDQIKIIRQCLHPSLLHTYPQQQDKRIARRDLKSELGIGHCLNNNASLKETSESCSLRSGLYEAMKSFLDAKSIKTKTTSQPPDSKTVWLFTNCLDPCHGNDEEMERVSVVAKDALDNGIKLQVWPLPFPHVSLSSTQAEYFDQTILFNRILSNPNIIRPRPKNSTCFTNLQNVLEEVSIKWKKVQKTQQISLLLPDRGITEYPDIKLDLYASLTERRKPNHTIIHQHTKRPTNKITQLLSVESGELLPSHEREFNDYTLCNKDYSPDFGGRIRYYYEFCGHKLYITKSEIASIKKKSNGYPNKQSLILFGFRKRNPSFIDNLWKHILDTPHLAYPSSPDSSEGRRTAFEKNLKACSALHASMNRKGVYGIGELLLRLNDCSRLVAIIPYYKGNDGMNVEESLQSNQNNLSNENVTPVFLLVPIPYAGDVRSIGMDTPMQSTLKKARLECGINSKREKYLSAENAIFNLVKNQNISGDIKYGKQFKNPALTKFWNYLESVALNIPLQDEKENDKKMKVGPLFESLQNDVNRLKDFFKDFD